MSENSKDYCTRGVGIGLDNYLSSAINPYWPLIGANLKNASSKNSQDFFTRGVGIGLCKYFCTAINPYWPLIGETPKSALKKASTISRSYPQPVQQQVHHTSISSERDLPRIPDEQLRRKNCCVIQTHDSHTFNYFMI